jgi:hypothetical protein
VLESGESNINFLKPDLSGCERFDLLGTRESPHYIEDLRRFFIYQFKNHLPFVYGILDVPLKHQGCSIELIGDLFIGLKVIRFSDVDDCVYFIAAPICFKQILR